MQHSAKYIIHADIRTSGVVERSDVVGAIFGQTEGLLGDDMDLRELQDGSKVGRIDVNIDSEGGRSFGTVRIASGLDRVETAVLAAALETLERVGPCRATCTVARIEDARAAKRRKIVDRAAELLSEFEDESLTSERLVDEVRERVREQDVTEFRGVPAGPRVAESDAIIVVEGRADVRKLVSFGIKNAIAVEGTDIPDAVARLTTERTTTVLLDGDRGGDLILRELAQVGNIDFVAFAPSGKSVEDLDRSAVIAALRKKLPYDQIKETSTPREAFAPTDGGTIDGYEGELATGNGVIESGSTPEGETEPTPPLAEAVDVDSTDAGESGDAPAEQTAVASTEKDTPVTLADHISAVIEASSGTARLLDGEFEPLAEVSVDDAFDTIEAMDTVPELIVIDGTVDQKLLDIAAQRGVEQIVGTETGSIVKQPTNVRVHTASELDQS